MTLEEWIESTAGMSLLAKNLRANVDSEMDGASEEDKQAMVRLNMIMVRQAVQDNGRASKEMITYVEAAEDFLKKHDSVKSRIHAKRLHRIAEALKKVRWIV